MVTKSNEPKELTGRQLKAAVLVAEDALSNKRIAEECAISEQTLLNWKKLPLFMTVVREKTQALDDAVSQLRFAKRRNRIEALDAMAADYLQIIAERAAWYGENYPGTPGGKTGRIVMQEKIIGTGRNATQTVEHVLDKGLDDGLRNTLIHIAKERGEWSDGKRELTGPNGTPLLPIIEIEVFKQMQPPANDDDDV